MSRVCESWSLKDFVEMEDEDMKALLTYYKPGEIPGLEDLRLGTELDRFAFDGSFGWW